jgi:hypothetical protein
MGTLRERRQSLDFDRGWLVVKWDDCDEFTHGIRTAFHQLEGGVSGADGVGARPGDGVGLIVEFKDYDHPDIPPSQRAAKAREAVSDKLVRLLVRKVIDTLCGATFSHDAADRRSAALRSWQSTIGSDASELLILFCIEVPRSQALAVLPWTKKLQQQLGWLGPRARVIVTSGDRPFAGAGVRYHVA